MNATATAPRRTGFGVTPTSSNRSISPKATVATGPSLPWTSIAVTPYVVKRRNRRSPCTPCPPAPPGGAWARDGGRKRSGDRRDSRPRRRPAAGSSAAAPAAAGTRRPASAAWPARGCPPRKRPRSYSRPLLSARGLSRGQAVSGADGHRHRITHIALRRLRALGHQVGQRRLNSRLQGSLGEASAMSCGPPRLLRGEAEAS